MRETISANLPASSGGVKTRIIRKANGETRFFEFPGGHVIAPAETLVDVLRWFDERDDG